MRNSRSLRRRRTIRESLSKSEMIRTLLDNDFEDASDDVHYDLFMPDRFYATWNMEDMKGFFIWNPDGNAHDVGPDITDFEDFLTYCYSFTEYGEGFNHSRELYEDALLAIGFKRVTPYKFEDRRKWVDSGEIAIFDIGEMEGTIIRDDGRPETGYPFYEFCEELGIIY